MRKLVTPLVAVILLLIVAGCGLLRPEKAVPGPLEPRTIVYISGFVAKPGTYQVPVGTKVADVVELAGGFTPDADKDKVNLQQSVTGVTELYIPKLNEPSPAAVKITTGPIPSADVPAERGEAVKPSPRVFRPVPVQEASTQEQQMLEMVNQERVSRGLNPLVMDARLVRIARLKSQDMIDNEYFSHQSPKLGSPSELIRSNNIAYRVMGENLAGHQTVESAHRGLMESPGHRHNILLPEFTKVGIGIIQGGPYGLMITQEFICE